MSITKTKRTAPHTSKSKVVRKAAHVAAKVRHGKAVSKTAQPYGMVNGKFDPVREYKRIDELCVKDGDISGSGPLASAEMALLSPAQFGQMAEAAGAGEHSDAFNALQGALDDSADEDDGGDAAFEAALGAAMDGDDSDYC